MVLVGDVDEDDNRAERSRLLSGDFIPFFYTFHFLCIFSMSPFVQVNIVHARPKTI